MTPNCGKNAKKWPFFNKNFIFICVFLAYVKIFYYLCTLNYAKALTRVHPNLLPPSDEREMTERQPRYKHLENERRKRNIANTAYREISRHTY